MGENKPVCDICGEEYSTRTNNPHPFPGSGCCTSCNINYVLPVRMMVASRRGALKFGATSGLVTTLYPQQGTTFELEELQEEVGGYIEIAPRTYLNNLIVINEDAVLKDLPLNEIFYKLSGLEYYGNVLLIDVELIE